MLAQLSFAYPLVLTALLTLPVIWFLLRAVPRAPLRQRFPGLFFLRQLKDTEETPARMPWPLLLLRLIILGLIIIACAGPVLNATRDSGSNAPIVIVLDDTWLAADNWTARRQAMQQIAAEADSNTRSLWLVTTAARLPAERDNALQGPMTPADLESLAQSLEPHPFAADRPAITPVLTTLGDRLGTAADIRWLSDGYFIGDNIAERGFVRTLQDLGTVTAYLPAEPPYHLMPVRYQAEALTATLRTPTPMADERAFTLNIVSRDGRVLDDMALNLPAGAAEAEAAIDLPLSLRNQIGAVRIAGARSAGAVQLNDASNRRALVGLAQAGDQLAGTLLDGHFYIEQALAPFALFERGPIDRLIAADVSVIVLDDFGRLRAEDRDDLEAWVEAGGVLIRFAGPTLADAAQDRRFNDIATLLPVPLRGGGRAFGGALTWEEPQPLGGFAEAGPFADLTVVPDILVRRQILARPGTQTAAGSWAWLEDGTPLVTATDRGDGLIVLFHVTASPSWSDLPVSGLFVDMLRRLASLSVTSARALDPETTYAPSRVLDGFGQLTEPAGDAAPVRAGAEAGPASPPGLYGSPDAPLAINTVRAETQITALNAIGAYDGGARRGYETSAPQRLATLFVLAAFGLFLLETLLSLLVQGKLMPPRGNVKTGAKSAAGLAVISLAAALSLSGEAHAQTSELRPPLDPKAVEAALDVRLGYVLTGIREIDMISEAGLRGLSERLTQRTALEPAGPMGIDLSADNLSVYPLIYWPITADTPLPPQYVLQKLEAYMAGGGMILFDTRDGERQLGDSQTAEGRALRLILEQLNIPPLEPLPPVHVLRRAFYLMDDLPGRNNQGPVWVMAGTESGNLNDGVTPVIIGGRDWAAAWATDPGGRPLRPMGAGGFQARELAYRSGINIAMVALTGNYKLDQLQTQALLDRLGTERDQP